ncbi:MAG: hypothetical protein F4X76_09580 [Chloroflexi bacterium]|nr:hypothetical protein [Chloroflexota bacterium]
MPRPRGQVTPSSGSTRISARRQRDERAARRERVTIVAVTVVLTVAAVVVLAGLYVTQYRPPRAHVLSVGETDYQADEVARRASYEARFGDLPGGIGEAVPGTLSVLEEQTILLERAPAFVGAATDEDVTQWLREHLGFAPPEAPAPPPAADAGDTGDAADAGGDGGAADDGATGEGSLKEDPEEEAARFAVALADWLRHVDLPKDEYDLVVAAGILSDRLRDHFRTEIGETADQVRVSRIRLADRGGAEDVRALLLEGADFAELAEERSAEAEYAALGGDLGWLPFGSLSAIAQAAIAGLGPGSISEVVDTGLFFDVYLVAEREAARPLDPAQIEALIESRWDEWLLAQRAMVSVERDLSDGEERWILDQLVGSLSSGGGS